MQAPLSLGFFSDSQGWKPASYHLGFLTGIQASIILPKQSNKYHHH